MPRHVISSLFVLFLFFASMSTAVAVTVEELYVAEIVTHSQTPLQRTRDAQKGLTQVIKRLSGTNDFADNAIIAAAIRRPDNYYSEYSYASVEKLVPDAAPAGSQPEDGMDLETEGNEVSSQRIRIRFEPNLVSKLLRDAGLPFWGSNRPNVLLWIALGDGNSRQFLNESGMDAFNVQLKQQAKILKSK